jgi:cellulose synthase/poly-beta-1,6-N-acetylglucosamine synthase-like glycosyltransferase
MQILAIVLSIISCLVALVWASRHLLITRERRGGVFLHSGSPGAAAEPLISVVVAAKDEEANIEACLSTMLGQDYGRFELIAVNDRSADRTGEIMARMAAADTRLRHIDIQELPAGWYGKNNAMQRGIASSLGEWILMTDADCRQLSPRTISVAVAYAQQTGADLLSVLPVLEMKGFWENVVQPVCSGVMMIWFRPDKVNDPARRNAYANGAFMLMKRSAYEAIGTHEAVRQQVNEDMHMAARIKAASMRLVVVRGADLYACRMYTSLRQTIRGWSRIFFGTFGTPARLAASLTVLVVMGLLPYAAAALGWATAASGWPYVACGALGTAAAMLQISAIYRFYSLISARKWLAWTYPLGALVAIICVISAMTKLRKGAKVVWRSTAYATGVNTRP